MIIIELNSLMYRNEEIRVPAVMILSLLATEKEAKDLLNDEALELLVGYLGKCVRNELPTPNTMWMGR